MAFYHVSTFSLQLQKALLSGCFDSYNEKS